MILSSSYRSAFAFALSSARRLRSGRERSNKATSDVHLLKEKKNKMKNTKMMMNKKISHLERREIWMNVLPSYTHTSFRWTLSGGLFLGSKHTHVSTKFTTPTKNKALRFSCSLRLLASLLPPIKYRHRKIIIIIVYLESVPFQLLSVWRDAYPSRERN